MCKCRRPQQDFACIASCCHNKTRRAEMISLTATGCTNAEHTALKRLDAQLTCCGDESIVTV